MTEAKNIIKMFKKFFLDAEMSLEKQAEKETCLSNYDEMFAPSFLTLNKMRNQIYKMRYQPRPKEQILREDFTGEIQKDKKQIYKYSKKANCKTHKICKKENEQFNENIKKNDSDKFSIMHLEERDLLRSEEGKRLLRKFYGLPPKHLQKYFLPSKKRTCQNKNCSRTKLEKNLLNKKWMEKNALISSTILGRLSIRFAVQALTNFIENKNDKIEDPMEPMVAHQIEELRSKMNHKFGKWDWDLFNLALDPKNLFCFLNNTLTCITEEGVFSHQGTRLRFKEMNCFIFDDFSNKIKFSTFTKKFTSAQRINLFLILSALHGKIDFLSIFINDISIMTFQMAKIIYIFLFFHHPSVFRLDQESITLLPRVACLLVVQICSQALAELSSCWNSSGLNSSHYNLLYILINDAEFSPEINSTMNKEQFSNYMKRYLSKKNCKNQERVLWKVVRKMISKFIYEMTGVSNFQPKANGCEPQTKKDDTKKCFNNLLDCVYNKKSIKVSVEDFNNHLKKLQETLTGEVLTQFKVLIDEREKKNKMTEKKNLTQEEKYIKVVKNFFKKIWEPELVKIADEMKITLRYSENFIDYESIKPEDLQSILKHPAIKPKLGKVLLEWDPVLVAKALSIFSRKDNTHFGKKYTYWNIFEPDSRTEYTLNSVETTEALELKNKDVYENDDVIYSKKKTKLNRTIPLSPREINQFSKIQNYLFNKMLKQISSEQISIGVMDEKLSNRFQIHSHMSFINSSKEK